MKGKQFPDWPQQVYLTTMKTAIKLVCVTVCVCAICMVNNFSVEFWLV